ncbi:MAG: 3-deoxy-D-manno-octulosonic acid transferase [Terriglobia bacterium]|jgi:3-deoxy-D-manno-octulosonic-acid transferase
MYLIYSVLFSVGVILTAPFYWWRKGRGQKPDFWAERFGGIPFQETSRGAIWVHAVSLGETLAVAGLVKEMQRTFPERRIYLSHVTPAGRAAGEVRLPSIAGRFYLPLDWRWTARKALARVRPALLVIVETELWPNLLRAAQESGARVVMVNARMSNRSLRGYQLVRAFMRRVLADVDQICAQTEEDAERFRQLGAHPERIRMVGNLKFDAQPPQLGEFARALKAALRKTQRGPVIVAASTMPGEEALVLQAWDLIQARYPGALLILAPRHPARFEEVSQDLARAQRGFVRRTTLQVEELPLSDQLASTSILFLDTIGELAGVFELADLVFIGGSLVPSGGHNLLEPAYWSKVIAFGPHMENFRDIAKLFLDAGAAIQVHNPEELAHAAWLLENKEARERLGANARRVLEQNSGATARTLMGLRKFLDRDAQGRAPLPHEVK